MSDFDAVLERLLNEPSFASALAADPDTTLSGYQLDTSEIELLRSQVSGDSEGGLAAVETRTNKSSTFGLFSSFAEVGHTLSAAPTADAALGPWSEFGSAAGVAAQHTADVLGQHGAAQGLGDAPQWGSGGGDVASQWAPGARSGLGPAGDTDLDGLPPTTRSGFGKAPHSGLGGDGLAQAEPEHLAPPKGYHPRIDADGDGHWDKAAYYGTKGHGVEIEVDLNHDGRADFVGHDTDSDGLVDSADYDKNHDGRFEKTQYDDNGDGWLDRTVWHEH
ncbi:MAG: hypothetical protein QOC94_1068 [Actinoplanes sp.]|jgi:hypothetical protein|nr:hypothetical protein [Actinoplanes sp.]